MNLRNPVAQARGLGSAKEGTSHWLWQRITAVGLAMLSVWFIWNLLSLIGGGYAESRSFLAQPHNAVLMSAYVLFLFYHAQLGLQVVIEDYVHVRWLEITLQLIVKFAACLVVLASLFAITRIALGS
jgi:succinate dehydrogenase / fumarate reductase membrane anchor subunit